MGKHRSQEGVRGGVWSIRKAVTVMIAATMLAAMPLASAAMAAAKITDPPPPLPGVPASVQVTAWFSIDLDGEYLWQSTKLLAGAESIGVIQVHQGFLIATDNPVDVHDETGAITHVPAGGALALKEGQQMEVIAPAGQARLMFVELVAPGGAFDNEQPDSTKAFTVSKGHYTSAVLAIPAGTTAPKPATVIAKASAPAIAVMPESTGVATPGAEGNGALWLVALFPATQ